ncbi:futalosine hydrolase [Phytohabitans sp. ZYX-F-186]|uniref:Futalosine hydrolase n=1 Tax=Phytohabitans maris TaxID=3071409 RepID=A0ABU0ZU39_9ACTN|nr:futalosine hydrolase [Phytohabitans sp. ZYX-F-186]MDQ7910558.1 futalosine hydrolase [Phytohabitans sp. ZYX-F-186]
MTLLVVTAVEAEAQAVRAGTSPDLVTVAAVGVGAAAVAAGTARLLALAEAAGRPHRGVVVAGIAGGFAGRAPVGATVLATRSVAADLGADSPDGFITLDDLGFGTAVAPADPALLETLRSALPDAITGDILTLNTATGTATTAETLAGRFPAAVAEAMEGYGAARAAAGASLPFAELRTISNTIGPRDRQAWRIPDALAALTKAVRALAA